MAGKASLKTLVGTFRRADAETGQAWEALVANMARRRRVLAQSKVKARATRRGSASRDVIAEGFATVTQALKEIDEKLETLVDAAEPAEAPAAAVAATPVAELAIAEGRGGSPPAGTGGVGGATVTQVKPQTPPPDEGPAPPSPAAVGTDVPAGPARRQLTELSDAELLDRIERLDRALDRARAVMIRRYIEVEKDLARVTPAKPRPAKPVVKPVRPVVKKEELSRDEVRGLQEALNTFSREHLKGLGPLVLDGVKGPATKKRIRLAKHYLGYTGTERKTAVVDEELMDRLRHPRSLRHSSPAMLARALGRRRKQRKAAKLSEAPRAGVARFDGEPVAAWMKPYLEWAREHGWQGSLTSGWRDPAHSERLCYDICGAPKCAGRCAGRSSNHSGSIRPAGSIDVSQPAQFAELMRRCPYQPRIFNALGARDPWHFSASGR